METNTIILNAIENNTKIAHQDAFNIAWDHAVVKLNPPCGGGMYAACRYRSYDKQNACFGGLLFPDSIYKTDFEGKTIQDIIEEYSFIAIKVLHRTATMPRFRIG